MKMVVTVHDDDCQKVGKVTDEREDLLAMAEQLPEGWHLALLNKCPWKG